MHKPSPRPFAAPRSRHGAPGTWGSRGRALLSVACGALVACAASDDADAPVDTNSGAATGAAAAATGVDPVGFGVAGTHTTNWATDGRRWTYNWGMGIPAGAVAQGGAIYLPMIATGPLCARYGKRTTGRLRDVPRYAAWVCRDDRCRIDARSVEVAASGQRTEWIFANGERTRFRSGASQPLDGPTPLGALTRYCGSKDASGTCVSPDRACFGQKGDACVIDTHEIVTVGAEQWESMTAQGKYYNQELVSGVVRNHGDLTAVARYCGSKDSSGACADPERPCFGAKAGACRFTSRAVTRYSESIVTTERYFNLARNGGVDSGRLDAVERYHYGPCRGAAADACAFDSREIYEAYGVKTESVTAVGPGGVGMYFNFEPDSVGDYCAPNDPSLADYLAEVDAYIASFPGPGRRWLVFNEPDVNGQANLPAEHAAKLYAVLRQRIRAQDPTAKIYVGGTVPANCNRPGCGDWLERFATALPSDVTIDAIHVHNYATEAGYDETFTPNGRAIIEGMKAFSARLQTQPRLRGKDILITEWGGLDEQTAKRCGSARPNNLLDNMRPVAAWLRTEGRSAYHYTGAAWFMDYCKTGSNCSRGSILYDSPNGTDDACGAGCARTCLGDEYLGPITGSW